MSFAAPVSKDGFFYNGDLWVELSSGLHRHKRATIPELSELLGPDKKSKSARPPGEKDNVGHWWEAQLLHYGLPPSRSKAVCKVRLLEALNSRSLAVPPSIKKVEDDLRKEFNAAERKAKAEHKAQMKEATPTVSTSNKRKQLHPEPVHVNNVHISINIGPNGETTPNAGGLGNDVTVPNAKKPRQMRAKATGNCGTTIASPQKKATAPKKQAKQQTEGQVGSSLCVGTSSQTSIEQKTSTKKKIDSGRSSTGKQPPPRKQVATMKKEPAVKKDVAVKKDPTVRKNSSNKKEVSVKEEPKTRNNPTLKQEPALGYGPAVKMETQSNSSPQRYPFPSNSSQTMPSMSPTTKTSQQSYTSLGLINGFYDIQCDEMFAEQIRNGASLVICLDGDSVWGAFDFGTSRGVMLFPHRPYRASNEPVQCMWRGVDTWTGETYGGEHCVGNVVFLGDGNIRGTLNLHGDCDFTGVRRPGPSPRSIASFREEWGDYSGSIC